MAYSDKVIEHYENPRNVGTLDKNDETVGTGLVVLTIGVLSGAFAARRRATSALWVSGGLSLMALDAIVWHCPSDDPGHNLFSHLGAAALLMLLASVAGLLVHRRQRGG